MSPGFQPTQQSVNAALGSMAISLRSVCEQIENFQTWAISYGQENMETLGFTSDDAAAVLVMGSYLNTIAGVYKGTLTQASQFDFDNALSALWGAA